MLSNSGKKVVSWLLKASARLFPKSTIRAFLKTEADLTKKEQRKIAKEVVSNPESRREFDIFVESMTPMDALYEGMMDEVEKAQELGATDWTNIECPTYAVHSTIDIDVGLDHPKRLERMIPNLHMDYVKAGGHFVWWGDEGQQVKLNTLRFLDEINQRSK